MKEYHTIRYIFNKLKLKMNQKMYPNEPWLTKDSIVLLTQLIRNSDIGFEFGSGRSTMWFASRCKFLYSVEHNKRWYDIVKAQIGNFNNIKYNFNEINLDSPIDSAYLSNLQELENESLDFILNDGKIRDLVAVKTMEKLKYGGLYIIDNAERYIANDFSLPESIGNDISKMSESWQAFTQKSNLWRRIWTTDGVTSTLVMIKA